MSVSFVLTILQLCSFYGISQAEVTSLCFWGRDSHFEVETNHLSSFNTLNGMYYVINETQWDLPVYSHSVPDCGISSPFYLYYTFYNEWVISTTIGSGSATSYAYCIDGTAETPDACEDWYIAQNDDSWEYFLDSDISFSKASSCPALTCASLEWDSDDSLDDCADASPFNATNMTNVYHGVQTNDNSNYSNISIDYYLWFNPLIFEWLCDYDVSYTCNDYSTVLKYAYPQWESLVSDETMDLETDSPTASYSITCRDASPTAEPTTEPTAETPTMAGVPTATDDPTTASPVTDTPVTDTPVTSTPTTWSPTMDGETRTPTSADPTTMTPTMEPTDKPTKIPLADGETHAPTNEPTDPPPTKAPLADGETHSPTKKPTKVADSAQTWSFLLAITISFFVAFI